MKSIVLALSALLLLFACTPENGAVLTITGDALDVTDYSATLTGYANLPFELGDAEVGIMYGKSKSFEGANRVAITGLDESNKFAVTVILLESSTTYYYKSYVQNGMAVKYGAVKSFTTKEAKIPVGAVDLGTVMTREDGTTYKIYWAKSNLCNSGFCANPEDYGDYYAWGETEPYYSSQAPLTWKDGKDGYNWSSYKWCNGSSTTITKYNIRSSYGTVDNKVVLEANDDVAHVKLGGKWRMPTYEEWYTLISQCHESEETWNGVKGVRINAFNGNSIFLPAAGYRFDDRSGEAGDCCHYWSTSLDTSEPCFAFFWCSKGHKGGFPRCYGFSVRPVSE